VVDEAAVDLGSGQLGHRAAPSGDDGRAAGERFENPNGSAKTTVEQRCCATEHARSLVAPIVPRQPLANAEP
jgi:hypothetical protein